MEVKLQAFLTWALNDYLWSASPSGYFITSINLDRRLGGPPSQYTKGGEEGNLQLSGIEHQSTRQKNFAIYKDLKNFVAVCNAVFCVRACARGSERERTKASCG